MHRSSIWYKKHEELLQEKSQENTHLMFLLGEDWENERKPAENYNFLH